MSLNEWDAPTGVYIGTIPPGTAAFRKVVAEVFDFSRTEVVRDKSRCTHSSSEHCECGAVDAFTVLYKKGRGFFEACVKVSGKLGIQSVIFWERVIGFGNPNERGYGGPSPHTDHVHVGLNRWARANLTEKMVRDAFAEIMEDDMFSDDDRKRLENLERKFDLLVTALISDDNAKVKAATTALGDPAGQGLWALAEQGRNYAKTAALNTELVPDQPSP